MEDFDIRRWADYIRSLDAGGEGGRADREYEEQGEYSVECDPTELALRRVAEVLRADAAEAPPDYAVRFVKAFFALQRPDSGRLPARLRFRLIFDSALELEAIGARGPADGERRMVYVADRYALNLSVERSVASGGAVIAGQILHRGGRALERAPAFLVSGGRVAASGVTGKGGDFRLEGGARGSCELLFLPDDETTLAALWDPEEQAQRFH